MNTLETLNAIGAKNLKGQLLADSIVHAKEKKDHTEITFGTKMLTTENVLKNDGEWIGLVMWVPRQALEKLNQKPVLTK